MEKKRSINIINEERRQDLMLSPPPIKEIYIPRDWDILCEGRSSGCGVHHRRYHPHERCRDQCTTMNGTMHCMSSSYVIPSLDDESCQSSFSCSSSVVSELCHETLSLYEKYASEEPVPIDIFASRRRQVVETEESGGVMRNLLSWIVKLGIIFVMLSLKNGSSSWGCQSRMIPLLSSDDSSVLASKAVQSLALFAILFGWTVLCCQRHPVLSFSLGRRSSSPS